MDGWIDGWIDWLMIDWFSTQLHWLDHQWDWNPAALQWGPGLFWHVLLGLFDFGRFCPPSILFIYLMTAYIYRWCIFIKTFLSVSQSQCLQTQWWADWLRRWLTADCFCSLCCCLTAQRIRNKPSTSTCRIKSKWSNKNKTNQPTINTWEQLCFHQPGPTRPDPAQPGPSSPLRCVKVNRGVSLTFLPAACPWTMQSSLSDWVDSLWSSLAAGGSSTSGRDTNRTEIRTLRFWACDPQQRLWEGSRKPVTRIWTQQRLASGCLLMWSNELRKMDAEGRH